MPKILNPKWWFTFFFSLIALCSYLFLEFYREARTMAIDRLNQAQEIHARQAVLGIQDTVKRWEQILISFVRMEQTGHLDFQRDKNFLEFFHKTYTDQITNITRMNEKGKIINSIPYDRKFIGMDISGQKHVQLLLKTQKTTISDVFQSVQNHSMISLHVPVFINGRFTGSIAVGLNFKKIAKRYLQVIKIGETGYAWLITRDGTEIYCPVPGHTGKSVYLNCAEFPTIITMANEMLKGKRGRTTYVFDMIRDKKVHQVKKHAVYMPIHLLNTYWSIVVASDEREILASLSGFRNRLVIIMLILIIGGSIFSFLGLKGYLVIREGQKRKVIEDALIESEKKYRTIVETAIEGIWAMDENFTTSFANQRMAEMLGYSTVEELLGKKVDYFMFPEDLTDHTKKMKNRQKGMGEIYERRFRRKDGSECRTLVSAVPNMREDQSFAGSFAMFTDITTLKELEKERVKLIEQLKESLEKANEANRLKSEFLAMMSHEIRTPLTGIVGFSHILFTDKNIDEEVRKTAEIIFNSSQRLNLLLANLLELSSLHAGKDVKIVLQQFDLRKLLNDIIILFQKNTESSQNEIILQFDCDNIIYSDPLRIQQILFNIIGNALKFTEHGKITITVEQQENILSIRIQDTGIGIPENKINEIFDVFQQIDNTSDRRKYQGVGIGLSLCKKFIEALNGEIKVESKPGKGSVFTIIIPRTPYQKISVIHQEQLPDMPSELPAARILFAEDDATSFNYLKSIFRTIQSSRNAGFTNGKELLDHFQKDGDYNVIFLDIQMPEMDGIECLKEIRKINKTIPVFAVTAFALKDDREKFISLGFTGYISKPIDTDELIKTLKEFIS